LISTNSYKRLIFELLICLPTQIPFYDQVDEIYRDFYQYINNFMLFFGAIWVYFIFRFVLMRFFMNEWSYRICFLNGC